MLQSVFAKTHDILMQQPHWRAGSAGAGSNYFVILTGQSAGASVDAKSKLSTTWANIKSN